MNGGFRVFTPLSPSLWNVFKLIVLLKHKSQLLPKWSSVYNSGDSVFTCLFELKNGNSAAISDLELWHHPCGSIPPSPNTFVNILHIKPS